MRVVNPNAVSPQDIQEGDVMMFVVKALVTGPGTYRLYRCTYEHYGIPQGSQIINESEVCEALFPSLAAVARPDYL